MKRYIIALLLFISPLFGEISEINKWYVSKAIGINYMHIPDKGIYSLDIDTGFYASLTLGHQFKDNVRGELENAFRVNSAYEIHRLNYVTQLKGKIKSFSSALNFLMDFPFQDDFVFTLGGGIGLHSTTGKIHYDFKMSNLSNKEEFNMRKEGIMIQAVASLKVIFTSALSSSLNYKFWHSPDFMQQNTLSCSLNLAF